MVSMCSANEREKPFLLLAVKMPGAVFSAPSIFWVAVGECILAEPAADPGDVETQWLDLFLCHEPSEAIS